MDVMVFISGVKDRIEQTIFQRLMQNVVYFLWLDILLKNKTKQNKTKKQQQHTHEAEKHSTILPPHMFHTRNCEWLWEGGKPVRSDDQAGLTWTSDVSLCGHGTLEKKKPKTKQKKPCVFEGRARHGDILTWVPLLISQSRAFLSLA